METQNQQNQPASKRNPFLGMLFGVLLLLFLNWVIFPSLSAYRIVETDYGTFISKVDSSLVRDVMIKNGIIYYTAADPQGNVTTYHTGAVGDSQLIDRLLMAKSPNPSGKISFKSIIPRENSPIVNSVLMWVLPGLCFYIVWRQLGKSLQARMRNDGNFMSFGGSGAKIYADSDVKTTFADVAGQDEAKEMLAEIVDFLHSPSKYAEIGASLPKGALLVGPPGTGKTLIARAVAGEAKVPFFSISGSEFVQMFVGMGAAKVRDLFKQANTKAPCIIFIDEIDAIGKRRDSAYGGNDEREQTLNQLLTEMDGFDGRKGVVILAATNRPESLDKALLRPGRFDRRVQMELPDLDGRKAILNVHLKKVKHDTVDTGLIARSTAGSSGAELANIVNEAALRAVRMGHGRVTTEDLEESVETVIAGQQKKNKVLSASEKKIVAYHEIGHALVAAMQTNSAPVHKITIIPRTSGASNDIEQATRLAREMVTRFGMTQKYDMMALETVNNAYLGGDSTLTCSSATAADVDNEVLSFIRKAHEKAREIISGNMEIMDEAASFLIEKETITGEEFMKIVRKHVS